MRLKDSLTTATADPDLHPLRARDVGGVDARGDVRAGFRVLLDGDGVATRVHAFTVLPEKVVRLEAPGAEAPVLRYQQGTARPVGEGAWQWTAPARPGIYALRVTTGADSVDLTALVLHSATSLRAGVLNGYRIGSYQAKPLKGSPAYVAPAGFVEVATADRDVLVTPHFTLGEFLCKQAGEPKYLALSPALLDKLEAITQVLVENGRSAASLAVMSGFRTPAYNAAIGNHTTYSRHLWGDAADVYVDADGNGDMDDLNGDGRSDIGDARVLAAWIEAAAAQAPVRPGGLAVYRRTTTHGPFVHVDARGVAARW
jgi:hypothetical protein